ncbi:CPBP family intramembrane glutamic endopeptidase [Mesoterricola silvestris]|uniref:CAAX prenyl protease 2/Lysostaphin resistance protein A-like domain-containing protein n=1 Tax=Mesoterricola silvestris TaxID=2927979 RepID=A0AA48KDW5_9BACT|nr:CPBP family intramembrane glutamic endopeptidase [Mesoterricola silvestris]BDU74858.1 hypothetical protein METEAL_40320 [Mesoterricola silvestris]
MDSRAPEPWNPDRAWADPFIATLALLVALAVSFNAGARRARPPRPSTRVELQGRVADATLAAPKVLGALAGTALGSGDALGSLERKTPPGWDRAVLAVHAAERGDLAMASRLAGTVPDPAFRAVWTWAYQGAGPAPLPGDRAAVRRALGEGYAAHMLEARCEARAGGDPGPAQARARAWALPRLAALATAGLGAFLLVLGGLAMALYHLAAAPPPLRPQPRFALPGRALLIVLLGWFLTHLGAGFVTGTVLAFLPFLKPASLPLTYGLHAVLGTLYLCRAEGISLRELAARVAPGPHGRALAEGLGFFALAFAAVVAVTVALSPLLRASEPPQRDLMDLLARTHGILPVGLLFLTVAVLAPVFEELVFRGLLLPWLGERLQPRLGRRGGWVLAVAVSGLLFGAMHLQPLGLPTLGTLGIVLGFAFLRTGNLLTCILVHGLWNGGIFLFMRAF